MLLVLDESLYVYTIKYQNKSISFYPCCNGTQKINLNQKFKI